VDIHELLATELSYFAAARISTKGDRVLLPARYAATLTLIFHELATNAAKHGALKLPNGQVSICWRLEGSTLRIEWSESGGPPVSPPRRRGFGTGLFRRALDPFHGTIETQFEPTGIRCQICLVIPGGEPAKSGLPGPIQVPAMSQKPL
jgi:two-component sensor histidine kinase